MSGITSPLFPAHTVLGHIDHYKGGIGVIPDDIFICIYIGAISRLISYHVNLYVVVKLMC